MANGETVVEINDKAIRSYIKKLLQVYNGKSKD